MYLNKAFIFGNLTRDPELKSLPSGTNVTSFGVATNRVWKDQSGEKKEDTEFHNIVVFGRQAETCAQYLKKGSSVFVEGRIQTRSWDGEGGKKYRTEIVAESIQFGPRGAAASGGASKPVADEPKAAKKEGAIEYPQEDINPDDIPF